MGGNIINEKIFKRKVMKKVVFVTVMMFGLSVFANAEWVTPKGIGEENWEDAKSICQSIGGRLPTKNELEKVITDCGGVLKEYDYNRANSSYQSCYKRKGFSSEKYYWSSTSISGSTGYAWVVGFYVGLVYHYNKDYYGYLRCVRAGQ
jgi:hypothetical protein